MTLQEFLEKYNFKNDGWHRFKDNKYYRVTREGELLPCELRTTKKFRNYRIVAQHFDCNQPYRVYYFVNKDNIVYRSDNFYPVYLRKTLMEMLLDLEKVEE